jgi:ATP-dependent exoDNAse (exonuclease V) beta subunit
MRRGARKEPTLYGYLKELEKDRSSHEAERLLYVAATRAKRALHWVGHVVPDAKGEIGPATGSLLALLWPVIDDEFAKAPVEETGAEGSPGSPPIPPLRRLAAVAVPECLRHGTAGPAQLVDVGGEAAEGEGDPPDAHVGILVHTYLELVARQGLDAWPTEGLRRLRPAMLAWLAQQGCAAAECNRGADRAVAVLTATLESEDGRWVLAAREDAAAELSLTRAGGEGASLHIVDRTFVEDGVRWIVDYKTAAVAGVPAVHAERYRGQLTRYAGLFQNEGQPIRMGVFYTAIGKLIELP